MKHRNSIKKITAIKSAQGIPVSFSSNVPHVQKTSFSLTNLKEIKLVDMNMTQDNVYNGYVLNGTILEPCLMMTSAHTIFEDDNGQVILACFYNYPNSTSVFVAGQRIAIINPYLRQAADGCCMIRVDDPQSVIFLVKERLCAYCGKTEREVPMSHCKHCQTSYCSRACQVEDWKTMEHKIVCRYLQNL